MTDQPTQPRPMTPNQLRAVVYKIAKTYLEVERGLRPPDQLAAFLHPAEYRRHRLPRREQSASSGTVRPTDIGRVRVDAGAPDRVNASVFVRRDDDRWSALLVDLKQTGGGWQVTRLDRLERLVGGEPRHVEIDEHAHGRRRRFVEHERRAVEAVSKVAAQRYERVPDKRRREVKAMRGERDRWRERLEELQAEATSLDQRQLLEGLVPIGELPDRDEPTGAESSVERILGARPDEPHPADAWDRAKEALKAYESRWELDSPTALLRSASLDVQESDRRDLLRILAKAARELEEAKKSLHPALAVQEQAIVSVES